MARRTPRRSTGTTPARRTTGRPPAIADETRVTKLLDAISAGVPITQACHYAGIHPASHHRAIVAAEAADDAAERGEDLDERQVAYREYRDRFTSARAAVAVVHVALINKAARGGQLVKETTRRHRDGSVETERQWSQVEWRAAAWLLAKSFPGELGDRQALEVSGPDGAPLPAGGDALAAIAERLAEVAERQRSQLPGGWDPGMEPRALPSRDVLPVQDAEIVDDSAEGSR